MVSIDRAGVDVRVRRGGAERRSVDYAAWSLADVLTFIRAWSDSCGWLLSLTDHVLASVWESAAEDAARYTFSQIACVESGSRIRMTGDGPPQWTTWLAVSRPSSRAFVQAWNAKRWAHGLAPQGAYVGGTEKKPIVGGKPLWLMSAIVRDYTAPGDIVCDPCAGGGTTLVAAVEAGRIAIGCEPDAERYGIACKRVREARRPMGAQTTATQLVLGAR
jgi:site-specific DNA-methyltransferase (adenine-specific)